MRLSTPILIIVSLVSSNAYRSHHAQDYRGQIDSLLSKLKVGFGEEAQVRAEIQKIAGKSEAARTEVIAALILILEDPGELKPDFGNYGSARRWIFAVRVLGDIGATEAIDILVRNLDQTGEFGTITSIHYRPVQTALRRIGEPAVPRLIEALSERDQLSERDRRIRVHAASTLAEIGQPAVAKLSDALRNGDAESRGGAALALGWIGGDEVREDIEHAHKKETDKKALKDMKYALNAIKEK